MKLTITYAELQDYVASHFHTKIICAVLVYNGCFYFVFIYSLSQ